MSQEVLELQNPPVSARRAVGRCFHCGEPCPDDSFTLDGRAFCCFGCQTVFSLLRENGLEQFYQLQTAPGVRVRVASAAAKWKFLDDSSVQEKLFDFADRTQARVTLHLPAIHCVACVWLLENLFKLHPGVGKSLVNFARREAAITFAPDKIKFSELAALLAAIGYEPQLTLGETEKPGSSSLRSRTWLQIGLAAFGFGNIMLLSLPFYFGLDSFNGPWFKALAGWLSLAMTLPVVTYSASDFWRAAWLGLRQRTLTLEVPIALGLAAIYLSSLFQVATRQGPGYCDSLTGLIFFLLSGRLFQKMTCDRLTFDRDYKGFFPLSVTRKTPVGEESVAISRLNAGDHVLLRNGELLPADARLISGAACVDYSFVTGEAEPVACEPGDHLYAGGRQVGGAIEVETIKPVAQSYLATLWNNEAFRKTRDNDLDSLTNRYSRRFTKLVFGTALGAAVFWLCQNPAVSLKAFTSVLIVACPCALALASPFTLGTAQRVLARSNIFVRNTFILETLARVNSVVLDKTGTLTSPGAESVVFHGEPLDGREEEWIFSLARHSTHPCALRVGETIGRRGTARAAEVRSFKEQPGAGILGLVAGHDLCLGSAAWLASRGVVVTTPGGGTGSVVHVAIDGRYRGCFVLANALRPQTSELITRLRGRYQLALLSGDNDRDREKFRELFGSSACLNFNQSPVDKLEFVRGLQKPGRVVMMVGDGLNDAGALQQSDVGAAVVESIGAFSPASDVIIEAGMVPRLADVLDYARSSVRMVRLGFLLSGVYNAVGVTIAARGQLSPVTCAILMPLSSVTVVAFACGLTRWLGHRAGLGRTRNPAPAKESTP